MPRLRAHRLVVLLVAVAMLLPATASAQSGQPQAYVNDVIGPVQVQGTAGLPGLSLELNFTLLDGQGQVMAAADILTATLQLASGNSYSAQVQKLDTPWSVVVLLDASKTLGVFSASATFSGMRKDVANVVAQFPDGTNIAVEKFDTQPTTILDFTQNKDQVSQAITKGFQASTSGTPCLYDAAYDAVNKLSGASGRRALLIATASASCSQRQASEVSDLAKRNHIQIYAIGLSGYSVTEQDLSPLTTATGGLVDMRELGLLNFGLANLVSSMRLQWKAKAILYPPAGHEQAVLKLTLSDLTQLSALPVLFDVSKDFAQPPSLNIKGVVISIKQGVHFSLDVVSPQLMSQLKLTITSLKTGQTVFEQLLPSIQATYDQPVTDLVLGDSYDLKVTALDKSGATLTQTSAQFQFQPPQSTFKITQVTTPTLQASMFVVQVDSTNLDVAKYKAWLQTDGQTDQINLNTVAVGDPIQVSAANVKTGVYEVVVQALDKTNTTVAQAISDKQTYQLAAPPSAQDLFNKWLREQPAAVAGITVVGCLAFFLLAFVVWVVMPKRESRPKTVELVVPEVKRRAPPVNLEASRSQSLPPQPAERPQAVRPAPPPGREAPPPSQRVEERRGTPPSAAAGAMPKACLSGYAPADLRVASTISKASFTIGRRNGNDLVLSVDNKIGVSGRHATIKFIDSRFYIVDDNSTYGTFVNDQRLPAGTPTPLEDTAVIGLGPKVKIQFRLNCP
jgi:hypothetical protein